MHEQAHDNDDDDAHKHQQMRRLSKNTITAK